MEHVLYEKVVLDGDDDTKRFLQCLSLRPPHMQFAQAHTTSLFLKGEIEPPRMLELLALCKGVTCLALDLDTDEFSKDGSALWSVLDALPLKYLMLSVNITFTDAITTSPKVFTHITHLDIHDECLLDEDHECFDTLNALTHLCVVLDRDYSKPLVVKRFVSNPRVQVLAFRVESPHSGAVEFLEEHGLLHDKIVLMPFFIAPWGSMGRGDMLLWQVAEEALKHPIPKKRESFISNLTFCSLIGLIQRGIGVCQ